jgi:hypothetical protein
MVYTGMSQIRFNNSNYNTSNRDLLEILQQLYLSNYVITDTYKKFSILLNLFHII